MGLRLGDVFGFGKSVLGIAQRIVGTDKRYGPIVEFNLNITNNRYDDKLKQSRDTMEEIGE